MVTLATSNSANALSAQGIQAKKDQPTAKADDSFNELRFHLSNELQSTLDLETTLRTFFNRVCSVVQCAGLVYKDSDKNLSLSFGEDAAHSAGYNVSSKSDQLGELQFLRKHPFAETELAILEMLIGVLFFPLRNSLKYRAALENSYIDVLTGLSNRQALDISSLREIKLAQRHNKALSMLVIDIDHFKATNDKFGHLAGDAVLSHIAKVINDTLRDSDQVFRFGGEEFIALLTETHMDHALMTAERIRKAVEDSLITNGDHEIKVTVSVGVASLAPEDDFNAIFQRADDALYQAKENGRNQVHSHRVGSEIKKIA